MAYKYGYCDGFTDVLCGSESIALPPATGKLGCSQHVAYIQTKCNGPRLCELGDITSLGYDRRLDDISEAFVEVAISGDVDSPCCSCLGDVEPWCHQLTIVREGDGVVWTGPVQKITYGFDKVRIEAKDKLAWLLVRINELDEDFSNGLTSLTMVAKLIIETAMIKDDDSPCFLDCVLDLGDGLDGPDGRKRFFPAFGGPTVFDDLLTLAESSIDFTVMNQCLILGPHTLPDVAIGILTDEHILGNIEVVKDGTRQGNQFYVRYTGDDDCTGTCTPQGALTCPCPAVRSGAQECYGLVERLIPNTLNIPDVTSAGTVADVLLANNRIAPRIVNFPSGTQLSPNTPWELNDMIPGQRIDVALSKLCLPIFQSFKLQQVTVEDNAEGEKISIDLKALDVVAN